MEQELYIRDWGGNKEKIYLNHFGEHFIITALEPGTAQLDLAAFYTANSILTIKITQ